MRVVAPLLLMLLATPAGALSRADCATLKLEIRALEKLDSARELLAQSQRDWQRGCAHHPSAPGAPARRFAAAPGHAAPPGVRLNPATRLSPDSVIEARKNPRFKVRVLDESEEAERMAPPRTRAAGSLPVQNEKPVPLF